MAVLESSKIDLVVRLGQNCVWRRPCHAPIDQIGTPLVLLDKACPHGNLPNVFPAVGDDGIFLVGEKRDGFQVVDADLNDDDLRL